MNYSDGRGITISKSPERTKSRTPWDFLRKDGKKRKHLLKNGSFPKISSNLTGKSASGAAPAANSARWPPLKPTAKATRFWITAPALNAISALPCAPETPSAKTTESGNTYLHFSPGSGDPPEQTCKSEFVRVIE